MAEDTRNLTEGPIWRAVAVVSAPMSLGIFAVLSIGLADAYFLGQVGQTQLAAVGYIYPVTAAITSLSIGLSAGANAALSQAIGREDDGNSVKRKAIHAIGLGTLLALVIALATWIATDWLFRLIGADDAVMAEITPYMRWWALSYPFLVAMMIANSAFRAHGNGLTAAIMMTIAAAINLALDPLLIFGLWGLPELGTGGAGLATLIARVVAAAVAIWWAWRRGHIGWCGRLFKNFRGSLSEILKVGMPASLSNAINPAGMAAVTAAVATLGEAYVAGFGAATRIQSLAFVPLLALSAGIGPVIGQNWGAERQDRARDAMRFTFGFCLVYGLSVAAILFFTADRIAAFVVSEGDAKEHAAAYLRLVGWTFAGYGILVTANAAMNARSKAIWSMSLSAARIGLVYLPLAWIGVFLMGFTGILVAAILANVLAAWASLVATRATGILDSDLPPIKAPAKLLPSST